MRFVLEFDIEKEITLTKTSLTTSWKMWLNINFEWCCNQLVMGMKMSLRTFEFFFALQMYSIVLPLDVFYSNLGCKHQLVGKTWFCFLFRFWSKHLCEWFRFQSGHKIDRKCVQLRTFSNLCWKRINSIKCEKCEEFWFDSKNEMCNKSRLYIKRSVNLFLNSPIQSISDRFFPCMSFQRALNQKMIARLFHWILSQF